MSARPIPGEYRVVEAEEHQLAAIPGIEHAAATLFSEADLPASIRYRTTDLETLGRAWQERRLWLAMSGMDFPVGYAYATEVDGQGHLAEVDVHPKHARRGIGSRLVMRACQWAKQREYRQITLITFEHVPWNAPFYRRLGFEAIDPQYLGDNIRTLLAEEAALGLDTSRRIVMRLCLQDD